MKYDDTLTINFMKRGITITLFLFVEMPWNKFLMENFESYREAGEDSVVKE
jgi:hypothetical protein